ncbi:MAG: ribulose-phosphate 3-epimerase [Planctomycetota bacterium]
MPQTKPLRIAGSILAGDVLNLAGAIRICEDAGADIIHLDICDGHFVPTLSFGEEIVRRACAATKLPCGVHLMVSRPQDWVDRMDGCGHVQMSFHLEATSRAMGIVQAIRGKGVAPAIAVNPETPTAAVAPLLPYIDNVCIMGIAPGFAGQQMLPTTPARVAEVAELIRQAGSSATIAVDGGVKAHNARALVEAGADILLLSSGIFSHANPLESLNEVRQAVLGSEPRA